MWTRDGSILFLTGFACFRGENRPFNNSASDPRKHATHRFGEYRTRSYGLQHDRGLAGEKPIVVAFQGRRAATAVLMIVARPQNGPRSILGRREQRFRRRIQTPVVTEID